MKKLVTLLVAFLCIHISATQAQSIPSSDEEAIYRIMGMQETSWNKGDIDTFMEGYWKSDSLLFIGSSGPIYGWQATMDRYKRVYSDRQKMGKLTFDILEVRSLGESHARLIGKFHLKREIGDLEGYFTLIWMKVDGEWLIISDHTS